MKKVVRMLVAGLLVAVSAFGFAACNGGGEAGPGAMATAHGKGHGGSPATSVIEATVVVDGNGNVKSVRFDEIMPINYTHTVKELSNVDYVVAKDKDGKDTSYVKGFVIAGKTFEIVVTDGAFTKYAEKDGGDIADLAAYTSGDGYDWYYTAVVENKAFYLQADTAKSAAVLKSTYGSIRKRYSTYWSAGNINQFSGLGIKGNWEALEDYLVAYGFGDSDTIAKNGLYQEINGVNTGATFSDIKLYYDVAKAAYEKALSLIG